METALEAVQSGSVTYAVRDTKSMVLKLKR